MGVTSIRANVLLTSPATGVARTALAAGAANRESITSPRR